MRPTPIPDDEVPSGYRRMVIGPPPGINALGSTIRPVEVLVGVAPDGGFVYLARIILEDGDLEHLTAGRPFWIAQWTDRLVPFDVATTLPEP